MTHKRGLKAQGPSCLTKVRVRQLPVKKRKILPYNLLDTYEQSSVLFFLVNLLRQTRTVQGKKRNWCGGAR